MTVVTFVTLDGMLVDVSAMNQVPRTGDLIRWPGDRRYAVASVTWNVDRDVEGTPAALVELRLEP